MKDKVYNLVMYERKEMSVFWVSVDRIKPNPYQPRHEFDDSKLGNLAESIQRYGVIQPLVVTKAESVSEDGSMSTEYILISGERRLRASKIAGITEVPVVIRDGQEEDQLKLELAIIENLHREDLNPVDRALAFRQLIEEFGLKQTEIADRVSKSREYISNSLRLLILPQKILDALKNGDMAEGHTRPLLMLQEKPEEQNTLFEEIIHRKLNVRDAERVARKTAILKTRKLSRSISPKVQELEKLISEKLNTRVYIDCKSGLGGKIMIDYFSEEDLDEIVNKLIEKKEEELEKAKRNNNDIYSFKNFSL